MWLLRVAAVVAAASSSAEAFAALSSRRALLSAAAPPPPPLSAPFPPGVTSFAYIGCFSTCQDWGPLAGLIMGDAFRFQADRNWATLSVRCLTMLTS